MSLPLLSLHTTWELNSNALVAAFIQGAISKMAS